MKKYLSLLLIASSVASAQISGGVTIQNATLTPAQYPEMLPPMGWNSWYGLSCAGTGACGSITAVTETNLKAQADALVSTGLSALGYTLFSIDDTWSSRDGSGNLQGIPAQFPSGMASLGTYIHGKGLLFGLYGAAGSTTCQVTYPAQWGHEVQDAAAAASWGVDFWKEDWCTDAGTLWGPNTPLFSTPAASMQRAYQVMSTAIAKSGRNMPLVVSLIPTSAPSFFQQVNGSSVRIGTDNGQTHWYLKAQGDLSYALPYQNKGHWLDPDYLFGGMSDNNGTHTVTDDEAKAQFNWYVSIAAPLVIGQKITLLDATLLATYGNTEVIAVDQDPLGVAGSLVSSTTCGSTVCQVWARKVVGGWAITLINYDTSAHSITANWSMFGESGTWNIRDLYSHSSVGSSSTGYTFSAGAFGTAGSPSSSTVLRLTR